MFSTVRDARVIPQWVLVALFVGLVFVTLLVLGPDFSVRQTRIVKVVNGEESRVEEQRKEENEGNLGSRGAVDDPTQKQPQSQPLVTAPQCPICVPCSDSGDDSVASYRGRKVYLDLGGNVGQSIQSFFKSYPDANRFAKVYVFEPDLRFHSLYFADYGMAVTPIARATWTSDKFVEFFSDTKLSWQATSTIQIMGGTSQKKVKVPSVDIARWLQAHVSISDYVVMKVNIEGSEYVILPYLVSTGAITLIDELWLSLHCAKVGRTQRDDLQLLRLIVDAHPTVQLFGWAEGGFSYKQSLIAEDRTLQTMYSLDMDQKSCPGFRTPHELADYHDGIPHLIEGLGEPKFENIGCPLLSPGDELRIAVIVFVSGVKPAPKFLESVFVNIEQRAFLWHPVRIILVTDLAVADVPQLSSSPYAHITRKSDPAAMFNALQEEQVLAQLKDTDYIFAYDATKWALLHEICEHALGQIVAVAGTSGELVPSIFGGKTGHVLALAKEVATDLGQAPVNDEILKISFNSYFDGTTGPDTILSLNALFEVPAALDLRT